MGIALRQMSQEFTQKFPEIAFENVAYGIAGVVSPNIFTTFTN
jgi:hypothetical protein